MAKLFDIKKASNPIVHGGRGFDHKMHDFTAQISKKEKRIRGTVIQWISKDQSKAFWVEPRF